MLLHGILGYPDSWEISNLELCLLFVTLEAVNGDEISFEDGVSPETIERSANAEPVSPDDPGWGIGAGLALWFVSILLILLTPVFLVLPYSLAMQVDSANLNDFLRNDKFAMLLQIGAIIPAHLVTVLLAWRIVTKGSRHSFFASLGWDLGNFRIWHGFVIVIGFFALVAVIGTYFPDQETPFEKILKSSREATLLLAFIATFSAPFVEEVVYRGVLFPAAGKSFGMVPAVGLVTLLFAAVHIPQYYNSVASLTLLLVLSLILTIVRASTGRLLPSVILHFIFNGIQSVFLVLQPYFPQLQESPKDSIGAFVSHLFQ